MFTVDASFFQFDLQNDSVFKYLFCAPWRKSVIDTGYHNYGGFTDLLKTTEGKIFNTGNYCIGNENSQKLDIQLGSFLNCFVESHYISVLPRCSVGEHYDIYDAADETVNATASDFINTSILYPVSGELEIIANGKTRFLKSGVFTVIDTSKLHDGLNTSDTLAWCLSSLCYNISYNQVKKAFSNYILEDLDE